MCFVHKYGIYGASADSAHDLWVVYYQLCLNEILLFFPSYVNTVPHTQEGTIMNGYVFFFFFVYLSMIITKLHVQFYSQMMVWSYLSQIKGDLLKFACSKMYCNIFCLFTQIFIFLYSKLYVPNLFCHNNFVGTASFCAPNIRAWPGCPIGANDNR